MKILFICFSGLKFTVDTPDKEPLGGTESAVCYLARAFAQRGHEVRLMSAIPEDLPESILGVQHLAMNDKLENYEPDIVIVPSAPSAVPGIQKAFPKAEVILWNHMRPDQPAMQGYFDPAVQAELKHVVFVSNIQKLAFAALNQPTTHQTTVIYNGIGPRFQNMFESAAEIAAFKDLKGAYTSTPYRGLAVLAHINELPIEVYSSMKVYQTDDDPYAAMYARLAENPNIEMKGSVSQYELSMRLKTCAFFVYPSIFPECHSIAILEAMAAGLRVVTTDCAIEPNPHVRVMPVDSSLEDYRAVLREEINFYQTNKDDWAEKRFQQIQYVNSNFNWALKSVQWETYLQGMLSAKNTS